MQWVFFGTECHRGRPNQPVMSHGIETKELDRFVLSGPDPNGIVIGFAAFDDQIITRGVACIALGFFPPDWAAQNDS